MLKGVFDGVDENLQNLASFEACIVAWQRLAGQQWAAPSSKLGPP